MWLEKYYGLFWLLHVLQFEGEKRGAAARDYGISAARYSGYETIHSRESGGPEEASFRGVIFTGETIALGYEPTDQLRLYTKESFSWICEPEAQASIGFLVLMVAFSSLERSSMIACLVMPLAQKQCYFGGGTE